MDRLINDKLLELELAKLGEPVTDEEVAESLGMDMERFTKTADKMKARIDSERKKLAVAKLLTRRALLQEPGDEELQKEYGKRRMIRLNVVNFKVAEGAPAEEEAAAKVKAEEFLAAVQGGKDFKEAGKDLSDDKLGRRAVRPMIVRDGEERHAEMWAAASALQENQYGGPVRTRFGFSVFEVVKKIEPKYSYEEMKDRLKKTVVSQKSIKAKKDLIEELRKSATIEYLVDFPKTAERPPLPDAARDLKAGLRPMPTAPRMPVLEPSVRDAGLKAAEEAVPAPAPVPETPAPAPEAAPAPATAPAPAAETPTPAPAP
ncbi:MAG: peptidyl-prolyl cis-trans isomerase [Deltaproteobacteria bacterium]|nr:peptidyl-prolyl cis-trans isomerase [Deltaproteobacteria bacterium]